MLKESTIDLDLEVILEEVRSELGDTSEMVEAETKKVDFGVRPVLHNKHQYQVLHGDWRVSRISFLLEC